MERELDQISLHAEKYAKTIAERLQAVFGDSAPSAKDIKSELQRQTKLGRQAVHEAEHDLQQDSATRDKLNQRLKKDFDDFNADVKRAQN